MSQNAYGVLGQYSTCCYYNWSGPALLVVKDFIFPSSINISFVGGPLLTFSQLTFLLVKAISCFQHHKTSKNWFKSGWWQLNKSSPPTPRLLLELLSRPPSPWMISFSCKILFLLPESPQKSNVSTISKFHNRFSGCMRVTYHLISQAKK